MNTRPDQTLAGCWRLDPQRSRVEFRAPHVWGLATVKGRFDRFAGRLDLSADPAIELTIDAASVQTGNPRRDRHLRSPDFFAAETHPQMRFASEAVVARADGLSVRGRLFARDRSLPLELDARIRRAGAELEIKAATSAPHRKLGMTWSPLGMIRGRSELRVSGRLVPATAEHKAAVRRFTDAVNSGDGERIARTIDELVAPDALIRTPVPLGATGRELLKEVFGRLHRVFPDLQVTIEDLIAEGDKVVSRNSVSGTHQGEYMGLAPTGRPVSYNEIFVFRFAGGRVVETWGVVDLFAQMRQLGLVAA
jgi:polyisoprenoid-binding protein YceI/predicted ester cyclase